MMMPAYYMMAAAVVGGVAVWFMTESRGSPAAGLRARRVGWVAGLVRTSN